MEEGDEGGIGEGYSEGEACEGSCASADAEGDHPCDEGVEERGVGYAEEEVDGDVFVPGLLVGWGGLRHFFGRPMS